MVVLNLLYCQSRTCRIALLYCDRVCKGVLKVMRRYWQGL